MLSRMMQLVNQTDNLYLTPQQQKKLLDYSKSLPRRFQAARALQELESDIVTRAISEWEQAHPELGSVSDFGWHEATGDLTGLLRAAVLATLVDDPDYTWQAAGSTLQLTLGFLDIPQKAIGDLFMVLLDAAREALPPAASETLIPYLAPLADLEPVTA